jgi:hypothetical protein
VGSLSQARARPEAAASPLFFPFAGKMNRVPLEVEVNGEELFVVDDKVLLLLLPSCLLVLASFKTCLLFFLLRFRHGPRPLLVSEL